MNKICPICKKEITVPSWARCSEACDRKHERKLNQIYRDKGRNINN